MWVRIPPGGLKFIGGGVIGSTLSFGVRSKGSNPFPRAVKGMTYTGDKKKISNSMARKEKLSLNE
jgi:hypothetical protein